MVIALLCSAEGCPVGVEVFDGNTQDASTVPEKIAQLQRLYGLKEIIFVGDRGMITKTVAEKIKGIEGLHTISALTHRQMVELLERKVITAELFDEGQIVEVFDPEEPKRRYCLCRNPQTAGREGRTRERLLERTRAELSRRPDSGGHCRSLRLDSSHGRRTIAGTGDDSHLGQPLDDSVGIPLRGRSLARAVREPAPWSIPGLYETGPPLRPLHAADCFQRLLDLVGPLCDFIIAEGALGGLKLRTQQDRILACAHFFAAENFYRDEAAQFGDAQCRHALMNFLELHAVVEYE